MLGEYIPQSEFVREVFLKLSEWMGWETPFHLEMTVLVVSAVMCLFMELALKAYGIYLAYTRFGSNMDASFSGLAMFKTGGYVAIFTFIPICLVLSALVGVTPPIGTVNFGFPDADYGKRY